MTILESIPDLAGAEVESSRRLFDGQLVSRPEIVVGLVGALGTQLNLVESALQSALFGVGYRSNVIRVSQLIAEAYEGSIAVKVDHITQIDALMDKGDALRTSVGHGAAAAALAITKSSGDRYLELGDSPDERESFATIIRQLKHPEEVRLLRSVYGPRFVLIGAWSPTAEREKSVRDRLQQMHPGKTPGWYAEQVSRLLHRDEKDGAIHRLGQRVRDTFGLADAFVALLPGQDPAPSIQRLVRLLFGAPFETPTWEEQAMFMAEGASFRSADAGRQVGAVVVDSDHEILVTGVNEVPKAGGGQYWAGEQIDYRDFKLGFDVNERQKLALITDVLLLLRDSHWLRNDLLGEEIDALARKALDDGPLSGSRVSDLLEFGRIAHAEMAAICTAARRGTALRGTTMMTTTYPCHECARLIIATGIDRVVYVDPYPKSQVPEMYRYQIGEGTSAADRKVSFEPFQGVAPRLYRSVFAMPDRSRDDVTGDYAPWDPSAAPPRLVAEAEAVLPLQGMEDFVIKELERALVAAGWIEPRSSD